MLIPFEVQQRLRANWGDLANSMECNVECRIYDPNSNWQWFIYAQNPEEVDQLVCIECTFDINPESIISMSLLESLFNHLGENMEYDIEFRPRVAKEIYKRLII